ncbi:MAG: hypothetical protein RPU34_12575 [Candidatus Sedimenticola sp. (ex Thyasira tokunagai)]
MIQSGIAKHSFQRLKEYARVQIDRDYNAKIDRPKTSIEVVCDCNLFLSSAAAISKLLFPSDRAAQTAKNRAMELRENIGVNDLTVLRSRNVRNSFEHTDERIDELLKTMGNADLCQIHIANKPPVSEFVLKRFNPATMEISFLNRQVDTQACIEEINELDQGIKWAMSNA